MKSRISASSRHWLTPNQDEQPESWLVATYDAAICFFRWMEQTSSAEDSLRRPILSCMMHPPHLLRPRGSAPRLGGS